MLLLNFSHPLSDSQAAQIEALVGEPPAVRTIPVQFDHEQPFAGQIAALADAAGLSAEEWQTTPLLVNLPGYAAAAGCLVAEIHGRSGHFPALLRLGPEPRSVPTIYKVCELIDLQQVRDSARRQRAPGAGGT